MKQIMNNKKFYPMEWLAHGVLIFFSLCSFLPFILLVIASITDEKTLLLNGYSFLPEKFSFESYRYLFANSSLGIFRAYGVTFLVTVVGTSLSLIVTSLFAYVLSRRDYKRRNFFTFMVFFTMLFNGGLVPSYIMWTNLFHIKNTILALVLPNLMMNGFYLLLMKSFFSQNIHPSLLEAAKIDGATEFKIYSVVVLPLSKPVFATTGLMVGINYWNDWMNGLYYLTDPKLFSLQNLLNRILASVKFIASISSTTSIHSDLPSSSIRMAMAVIGVIPIFVLYPFFQRYFIKGISLGGVKE